MRTASVTELGNPNDTRVVKLSSKLPTGEPWANQEVMPHRPRRHTSRPLTAALVAAVVAVTGMGTGGCGRGEDRPGQITTETPAGDRGQPTGDD